MPLDFNARLPIKKPIGPSYLYVLKNPAWSEWLKIGVCRTNGAYALRDRVLNYQTAAPFRDYEIVYTLQVSLACKFEKLLLKQFKEVRNEWVRISLDLLVQEIERLKIDYI